MIGLFQHKIGKQQGGISCSIIRIKGVNLIEEVISVMANVLAKR